MDCARKNMEKNRICVNMKDFSDIQVTREYNSVGALEKQTYKTVGKSPYFRFSWWELNRMGYYKGIPKEICLGQYKFVFVERDLFDPYIVYTLKKGFYWLRVLQSPMLKMLDVIYRRIIITLAVWNLATYNAARLPCWRDIKLFKKK